MLKFRIEKTDYDKLPKDVQGEYKADGDKYVLDVEGNGDADALRRAKDHEAAERKREKDRADAAEAKVRETEETVRRAADDAAKKSGDVTAIEASWKKKLEDAETANATKITKLEASLSNLLVTDKARELASKISTAPELILPHIMRRLAAETGDTPITRVLDKDGKPSALNLEDLGKEFVADERFAAIMIGSNATGGGAGNGRGGGGASKTKLSEMNEPERVKLARENPTEFARLRELERAG